jgi:hypothetical protein
LEYNSRKKNCAEFSKEATPEVTKEEPILRKLEEEHNKSRTTPRVDFAESNETNKRSMSSVKPLREFEPMDWVQIDYGEVFDKRRPFPNQKGMERALEVDFLPEKKVEDSYDLETTSDGYSGFMQIPIHPDDQHKTTFTCPYGTFAYRRMPFGLCNAPASFQCCMMAVFSEFIEEIVEVFMDDFSVYGKTFMDCFANLDKVLTRCEEVACVKLGKVPLHG